MDKQERERIIRLVKSQVVPAVGCTEPVAVALCVAKASETLGALPEQIDVKLSANILKNAMGVGIPGTGMIGLPIAIALGASIGKSEYQLEVLKDVNPELARTRQEPSFRVDTLVFPWWRKMVKFFLKRVLQQKADSRNAVAKSLISTWFMNLLPLLRSRR